MMSNKKMSKKAVVTVLSAVTLGATSMVMIGCSKGSGAQYVGFIDAPTTLQAELGTYAVPEYDVVDKNGMVLYGYNVKLKSVTDANGAAVEITNRAVTVETAGIYNFVYTANNSGVQDATVKIDFADRTAPTINYDDANLPSFYITGNSYKMPAYTVSGDFDREKCYAKVFHIANDKTETEITVESNRFKVDKTSGSYAIRIHVEDAVGNVNDYEYVRSVDGPEHYVEDKVLYFDEEFGARQVSLQQPDKYTGKFVSKESDGAHVYDGERGAYKVSFDGVTETQNNEGYINMDVPAVIDITDYIELEMYVYNDSEADIIMGSKWWNDTKVEKGKWTRLTWAVDSAGWSSNVNYNSTKVVGAVDITGMTIRFIFDYDQKIIPNGDFYLSSMRAVPKVKSTVTAGENVSLERLDGAYFTGETVNLTAAQISGKTFDCFLVDGKPIIGDSFVTSKTAHAVTAKYIDGTLTKDNMTWGVVESYETEGGDAKKYKIGESDHWVLSYDLYGIGGTGWNYFGAYVGGEHQLVGIELAGTTVHKAACYGGSWKNLGDIILSDEVTALLRGATEDNPVTAIYIREGNEVKMLLKTEEKYYLIASWNFDEFEITGDGFGIGERRDPTNATLKNIKGVAGKERVAAFNQNLKVDIIKTGVSTDKTEYYLGDTVLLTADTAPADKAFAYFEVDGKRLVGNSFVITEVKAYEVKAIYLEPEKTYKVTVADYDSHAKTDNGKYTLPTAVVTDNDGNVKDYTVTVTEVTDTAGNRYTVTDGKIDILYTGSVRLTITYAAQTLASEYNIVTVHVTVQSGATLFAPTDKTLGYVKNADSNTSTFEYVTDIKHGTDAGSIKVTPDKSDTGFTIEDFDFTGYDFVEFYAYTEGAGLQAGAYWLGDTELTQNDWTKIVIDLKGNVYLKDMNGSDYIPNGRDKDKPFTGKFILRVMANENKNPVWISSVIAGNWAEATITPVDANVTLDKTSYKVNDTVTLSAANAPTGKIFSHFTVDGTAIKGNTFKITNAEHTVAAVYTEISDIVLAENSGISTDDNKTQYARGAIVTLIFDESMTPNGKVFNGFMVDGVKLNGNTFVTSKASHEITAEYITSVSEMTWNTVADYQTSGTDAKVYKMGESDHWVLSYDLYGIAGTGWNYFGVYVGGNNQIIGIELAGTTVHKAACYGGSWEYKDEIVLSDEVTALLRGATEAKPITAIYMRDGDTIKMLLKSEEKYYLIVTLDFKDLKITGDGFGIGERKDPTNATLKNIKFVSGVGKVGLYAESLKTTVNKTSVTTDKVSYYVGDTVTLTADAAPSGKAFSHFTVDGAAIVGNTFTVTKLTHAVAAVYADTSDLTLTDGITTAEGKTQYARGALVKLWFDESKLGGKVLDYFVIDAGTQSEQRVYNGAFTTSAATHSVTAVLVAPEAITWANGGTEYNYETVMGADASVWKSRNLDGEVYGSAEYWAVSAYVKFTEEWKSIEFIQGSKQSIRIRFHSNGYCGVILTDNDGKEQAPSKDFSIAYPTMNTFVVNKLKNGATVTCVRNGSSISMYIDGCLFFATDYAVDHTGDWFGVGHVTGNDATKPDVINSTKYITGKAKVAAYLSSLNVNKNSENQLNYIGENYKAVSNITSMEYVTDKKYDGSDENVKESGSLKVTVNGTDCGVATDRNFVIDLSAYSEVYFYVYTDVTDAQSGAYWCGDTTLTSGAWTKISLNAAMPSGGPWNNTADSNGNKKIFEVGLKDMVMRFMGCKAGDVFYVTSLYGVPKEA